MKKRFTWSSFKVDARLNLHVFCVTDNLHILPVERFYNMRKNSAKLVPYNEMRSIVAERCKELNRKNKK